MMNPVAEAAEPRPLPSGLLPLLPASAASVDDPGIGALLRFKSLMASEGQHVELGRLCHDRLYAYERIAAAHASASEPLRRLALELFQIHHRRPVGLPAQ